MRKPYQVITNFVGSAFLMMLFFLSACAGQSPTRSPLPTAIPPYVATDQASAIQARSTIQAGEAMASNLALTGTAVSMEVNMQSTQVALQLTQSAATEQYLNRQTEIAGAATSTAISQQGTGTSIAQQAAATATAQVATATQMAIDASVRATATQFAINEMIRQDESQQQTLLFRTWAWRIVLILCFILGVVLIWQATPWVLLKLFGIHSWNGKPIIIVPNPKGGFQAADIARSLGPGLVMDSNGNLLTTGMATDPQIQNAVTARAQAAELLLALREQAPEIRKRVVRQAIQAAPASSQALLQAAPPEDVVDAQIKILPSGDARVSEWLHEIEGNLANDLDE